MILRKYAENTILFTKKIWLSSREIRLFFYLKYLEVLHIQDKAIVNISLF